MSWLYEFMKKKQTEKYIHRVGVLINAPMRIQVSNPIHDLCIQPHMLQHVRRIPSTMSHSVFCNKIRRPSDHRRMAKFDGTMNGASISRRIRSVRVEDDAVISWMEYVTTPGKEDQMCLSGDGGVKKNL